MNWKESREAGKTCPRCAEARTRLVATGYTLSAPYDHGDNMCAAQSVETYGPNTFGHPKGLHTGPPGPLPGLRAGPRSGRMPGLRRGETMKTRKPLPIVEALLIAGTIAAMWCVFVLAWAILPR